MFLSWLSKRLWKSTVYCLVFFSRFFLICLHHVPFLLSPNSCGPWKLCWLGPPPHGVEILSCLLKIVFRAVWRLFFSISNSPSGFIIIGFHRFSRWVTQPTNLSLDWFCWKNLNRKPWAFTIKYGGSCIFSLKPIHWKMVMFRILPCAELVILLLDLTYSWRTLAALASGSWRNLTNGRWADERMNENGLTSGINGEIDVNDIHIIYYSNIRTYIIYIYILKYV